MVSSRLAVASILLIFSAAVSASSQKTPEKSAANGSISGKVTIKDKGAAGIIVFAEEQNYGPYTNKTMLRATTDSTGSYRITNVPAGTYNVQPITPVFALDGEINSLVVSEGESIDGINFSLIPGGVITGKITDADGRPLIEENVNVLLTNGSVITVHGDGLIRTDDRGIYRAYGLRPGKYQVWVGRDESLPDGPRPAYRRTFYPSVTDMAKATDIEVTEGSETKNIDIVVGRPPATFKVSGRVLHAETGKPLVRIKYGVYKSHGEYGSSSSVGENFTNVNGEFGLENVLPGTYAVFIVPEDSGVRGDSVSFEVVDHDVTDLVIRAGNAATVSGVVVVEGANSKTGNKATGLYITAWAEGREETRFAGSYSQLIKPDGSFRIGDIQQGLNQFTLFAPTGNEVPLEIVRIERDGVVQPRGLMVKDGEQVTGVRLVAKHLTGSISGQIKVEGGELPPGSYVVVWITYLNENGVSDPYGMGNSQPQLDARRRFVVQGLAAGTYEVNVRVLEAGREEAFREFRQKVTVVDNTASEVTITIKSKP